MSQLEAKDSEIKDDALPLSNISKDFTIDKIKWTGLKGNVNFFSIAFNPINANDVLDLYIFKKVHNLKQCLG